MCAFHCPIRYASALTVGKDGDGEGGDNHHAVEHSIGSFRLISELSHATAASSKPR